ncbi:maleylpyruvate isomerase family mycothiol-dependent enzyme [Nocardioides sp. SYSU DS0651]|uniref:maleylpyruvate isomerase family mycothiol-dependent enzyme n=1 Tax=Nocardioides sp. SYSU DS0651 TaxID=3415955 RepID=UPI003F4BBF39
MTRLSPAPYLEHIRADSARFAQVLAECAPDARVPTCPDWDAADLLWHLGTVQHFWHHVISTRPAPPEEYVRPERPASYDGLLEFFATWHERFVTALAAADADEPAWSWADGAEQQTVGFTYRRQAHEALIHRVDADLTAGSAGGLDPALAADGVHEVLEVMHAAPSWGRFMPLDQHLEVRLTDTGDTAWAALGRFTGTSPGDGAVYDDEPALHVLPTRPGRVDVVVSGPAAELDAWLWHRGPGAEVSVTGDDAARRQVLALLDQPID